MDSRKKVLSAPLRVYWDLRPEAAGGLPPDIVSRVSGELAALRVFFVTLRLSGGKRDDIKAAVSAIKKGGARVTVSCTDAASVPEGAEADGFDLLPADAQSLRGLLAAAALPRNKPLSVSAVPARGGADALREMLAEAASAGVRTFNLINPDIIEDTGGAGRYALDGSERPAYRAAVQAALGRYGGEVRLHVHDLFLHKALSGIAGLGGVVEYAGCQAGDAIAYIDRAGRVFPCASFPAPLGDLKEKSLKEIWASAERLELRARIAAVPGKCEGCAEVKVCMGGCRGLAWAVGGFDAADPNCDKPGR